MSATPSQPRWSVPVIVGQLSLAVAVAAATVAIVTLAHAAESQTVIYALFFFVLLPAVVLAGPPLGRVLSELPAPGAATLSGVGAAGILAVVIVARGATAAGADAMPFLIGGVTAWCAAATVGLSTRAGRVRHLLERAPPRVARSAWAVAAAFAVAGMLAFLPHRLLAPGPLGVSVVVTGVLIALLLGAEKVRFGPRAGLLVDVGAVVVIVLGVVDASVALLHLSSGAPRPASQGFYLGPVSDVLHGRAVLVDTFAQYGIGVIYFLAAVFAVIPFGYGPMSLVTGGLTGLAFAGGYASLRLAGCRRVLAAIALAVGIVITQLNSIGSVADYPSTGALRFGPAYLIILAVAVRARWPARCRQLRMVELALVGLSAVWSAEALACAIAIVFVAHGIEAATVGGSWAVRGRRWAAQIGWSLGAATAALALFMVLTRLSAGEWPDWSPYFALLNVYSDHTVVIGVFPAIPAWSTGIVVGSIYVASLVAAARLAVAERVSPGLRVRLIVLSAMATFGIASLGYWITHGFPFTLRWMALPAVLVCALWVDLLLRARPVLSRTLWFGGLGFASWTAALVVIFAWPAIQQTGERTALVHALPGSPSFRQDVGSLWHSPRYDPRSLEAEALLRAYSPGHRPIVMLTGSDLGLEVLMRSGRVNALPLGYPLQSDLIPTYVLARVRRAIDRLPSGTLGLTEVANAQNVIDAQVQEMFALLEGRFNPHHRTGVLGPLQRDIVALLQGRFHPRILARTRSGLILFRLDRRGATRPSA